MEAARKILGTQKVIKAMLAAYCEAHGLKKSGLKLDLLKRVKTHYDNTSVNMDGENDNRGAETLLVDAGIANEGVLEDANELDEEEPSERDS